MVKTHSRNYSQSEIKVSNEINIFRCFYKSIYGYLWKFSVLKNMGDSK